MTTLKSSQHGFGLIEGLLSVIAVTLIIGVGFYIKDNNSSKSAVAPTTKTTTQPAAKAPVTTKPVSDIDLIVAAVKSYVGPSRSSQQNATVDQSNITIVGDNAKGSVEFPPDGGGAAFIAHKDNGTWKVIFEGQQAPDPSLGAQYNLPTSWYTPS